MKELSIKDKELLLKDLCARLPYGVIVAYKSRENKEGRVELGYGNIGYVAELGRGWWAACKPYLRPMSSMPQKEKSELYDIFQECPTIIKTFPSHAEFFIYADIIDSIDMVNVIDWLNAHHFDYRGLIPKGLAIEAPEGMYK